MSPTNSALGATRSVNHRPRTAACSRSSASSSSTPAKLTAADWRLASRFVQLDEATHGVVSAAEDLGLDPKSALIHYADLLDLGDLLRTSLDGAIPEDPLCAGCAADDG